MKIENLKQLQDVIKICKKLGVDTIEVGDIKMTFKAITSSTTKRSRQPKRTQELTTDGTMDVSDVIETDELTPDQLLFFSAVPNEERQEQ